MAVAKGRFQLYPKIDPPLKAGSYRFTTRQQLTASGPHGALDSDELGVEELTTHVRVRSPQYLLPPDQVLSTFPPADREGSFGSRLPQVVIKRRTLPWERQVDEAHPDEPWLALVLIAEGEAELKLNQKVGDCVTPGVHLDPPADVEQGNYLSVRESVVHRIFPTQEEVRLLAHAREVDVSDTELMMGDDDGFLAVVISNRLPLPARDSAGVEAPVKYLACLVNLCGQWDRLLDKAPVNRFSTVAPALLDATRYNLAEVDHATMQVAQPQPQGLISKAAAEARTTVSRPSVDPGTAAPFVGASGWSGSAKAEDAVEVGNIYSRMAAPFALAATTGFVIGDVIAFDPQVRFPVLLHWSFTSVGDETFESIMGALDSGLLGTAAPTTEGRPPLEVVETGHTGLAHRLRGGDEVRSWYRGPLVPHPTDDDPAKRLPLAHAADQVRSVVPDGREDISLAAAFEIGRMLGLSRPSVVAALLRWRQGGYQTANLRGGFAAARLGEALDGLQLGVDRLVGGRVGALVAERMLGRPADVLGDPSPLATAGRAVLQDRDTRDVLSVGLGIDPQVLTGSAGQVLGRLGRLSPDGAGTVFPTTVDGLRSGLTRTVDESFSRAAVQALAPELADGTLDAGQVALPLDLQQHLATALVPDVGVLRQRLDLDIDLAAVPHGADALDLLMQARRQHDERTGPEEDR